MKYRHSHPINILEYTSRYLFLLLLPLLRALFVFLLTDMPFLQWLSGVWFDILVVLVIIGMGFIAWFCYVYRLMPDGLEVRKGILLVKRRFIPYHRLSIVTVEWPWYLIPVGAVHVAADTDGGAATVADFSITLRKKELSALLAYTQKPFLNPSEMKRVYLPKNIYVAILSFVASNSLTGVLFMATFVSGAGKVLGEQFEREFVAHVTSAAQLLAFGLPPVAALLAFVVLGGWMVSFFQNLIRHLRFSVTRQSGSITVRSGLVTRREYDITVKRINLIELRQNLLTKLFGFYTVLIHVNGYGKKKDELSVLMPAGESEELSRNLELLLPEIPICKPRLRPKINYLSRFLIPPLLWILLFSGLWFLAWQLFPDWREISLYFGTMAEIPCIWYLFVKIASFLHTGVGESAGAYTFCYTYGYRFKTVAVPKERVVHFTIRRSLFQMMSGSCDLVILTYSEGRKRHVVPNLPYEEVRRFMGAQDCCKPCKPLIDRILERIRKP